jgi:peptidoglycan/xylan/chitin deacetylase (PgdA/CDA1 family)
MCAGQQAPDLGRNTPPGADPLVTIGAHTCRHFALAKLTLSEAHDEIAQSLVRIERELGLPCRHLG